MRNVSSATRKVTNAPRDGAVGPSPPHARETHDKIMVAKSCSAQAGGRDFIASSRWDVWSAIAVLSPFLSALAAVIPLDYFASESNVRAPAARSVLIEQPLDLARHPVLAERLTNRVVDAAKTAESLTVAKQVHDTRMLL